MCVLTKEFEIRERQVWVGGVAKLLKSMASNSIVKMYQRGIVESQLQPLNLLYIMIITTKIMSFHVTRWVKVPNSLKDTQSIMQKHCFVYDYFGLILIYIE